MRSALRWDRGEREPSADASAAVAATGGASMSGGKRPVASIVVPAHDEEARIGATLRVLHAEAERGEFETIVVCNGCTDATADEARRFSDVQVVEISEASKIAALREGDRRSVIFPRIYLDGDVELDTATARAMAAALSRGEGAVAGVPGRYDLRGVSRLVALYYEFSQRLPVFTDGIIGAGVYAVSAEGRRRFGEWPEVIADDQFIYRLFAPHERIVLRDRCTLVQPPRDLSTFVRRAVRVRQGNDQLTSDLSLSPPPAGLGPALRGSLRSPRAAISALVFVVVTSIVRLQARFGRGGDWTPSRTG